MPNNDTMSNARHTPEVIKAWRRERHRQALLAAAMPAPSGSAVLVSAETLKVVREALRRAVSQNQFTRHCEQMEDALRLLAALGGES